MIDWDAIAVRLGYLSETLMWKDLYEAKSLSMTILAQQFGVSKVAIRNNLLRCEVAIRPRGGAQTDTPLPEDIDDQIERDGLAAVAERLGLKPNTVYKKVREARSSARRDNEKH